MDDLSKPYRGVAYFGIWADESADDYGRRDALTILAYGIEATQDRDLRHDGALIVTLDYLTEQSGCRHAVIARYRKALDIEHPVTRRRELAAAYRAICASVAGIV